MKQAIKTGVYQHYKGNKYLVLGVAKHSETLAELVIYISLYDNETAHIWARPLEMFTEKIVKEGKEVMRFKYIGGY